jgi:hypothetical protein
VNEEKREEHSKAMRQIIDDMGVEWVLREIADHAESVIDKFGLKGKGAMTLRGTVAKLIGLWQYQ